MKKHCQVCLHGEAAAFNTMQLHCRGIYLHAYCYEVRQHSVLCVCVLFALSWLTDAVFVCMKERKQGLDIRGATTKVGIILRLHAVS